MDALKTGEVKRMELGGNRPWKVFFNGHQSNQVSGQEFDSCTIAERYDSEAGEEWKERLTAKIEGTEYVPGASKSKPAKKEGGISEGMGVTPAGSGRNTPNLSRVTSPPQRTISPSQKVQNEAYFARMGSQNATRPDDLAPSQGGKFAGFGSSPAPPASSSNGGTVPTADEFQRDPVAALTKGFGWLSSTVSKQAASVNKIYIQPGVKSLAEGDLAAQARATAGKLGTTVQQGTRGLGDQFNRFVDPEQQHPQGGAGVGGAGRSRGVVQPEKKDFWDSFGADPAGPPKEKQDFWDDFAAAGESAAHSKAASKPSSIGTSAMKTSSGGAGNGSAGAKREEGESGWGDW